MSSMNAYLSIDFGANSGRIIVGYFLHDELVLDEVHRFQNRLIKLGNHLYWDFLYLFEEMKTGMKLAAQKGYSIKSIGIDTWGVDFGLIDKQGNLLGNPVSYRDNRTAGLPDELFTHLDQAAHYRETGIQVMEINTLFQLLSMVKSDSSILSVADKLLFMPDLFSYYLTGVANNEYTIASTSELLDVHKKSWLKKFIDELEIPSHLFGEIIQPGTIRGKLKSDIAAETGLDSNLNVVAVASHDTASAVLAIPSTKKQIAFISSGTWSLIGAVVNEPIVTEEARLAEYTNEGGFGNIRFLRNTTGLWILQNLMREWSGKKKGVTYNLVLKEADSADIDTVIDVDDDSFVNPVNMQQAIIAYCNEHKLRSHETRGEYVRVVLESLAIKYLEAFKNLQKLVPETITELHVIGGGSQNDLLNQLTANKLGIPVIAGPVEATAIGNILVQGLANNEYSSLNDMKAILEKCISTKVFKPFNKE